MRGLCQSSSYTLTFNVYNNVLKKCRKVGGIIGGNAVVTGTTSASGELKETVPELKNIAIVPRATIAEMNLMGASCLVRLNNVFNPAYGGYPYDQCFRPPCPLVLCSGVKMEAPEVIEAIVVPAPPPPPPAL